VVTFADHTPVVVSAPVSHRREAREEGVEMRSFLLAAVLLVFGLGVTALVAELLQTSQTQRLDTVVDIQGAGPPRVADPAANRRSAPSPAQPMVKSQ